MCSLDILIAGKYRLGRKLGGGSFGEIFLGTNLQTGEEVGIKLVSQHLRVGCGGLWVLLDCLGLAGAISASCCRGLGPNFFCGGWHRPAVGLPDYVV